jgi:hypothetical protein
MASHEQTNRRSKKSLKVLKRRKALASSNVSKSSEEADETSGTSTSKSATSGAAYAMFSLKNQQTIRNQLPPNTSVDSVAKAIEQRWSNLSEEEKQRWGLAMSSSSSNSEDSIPHKTCALSKPKRPLSAYFYFEKEMRPKIKSDFPTLGGNDVTKEIAILWRGLHEKEKLPYINKEIEAKSTYDEAMDQWKEALLLGNTSKALEFSSRRGTTEFQEEEKDEDNYKFDSSLASKKYEH